MLKRGFDIFLSLTGLIILLPVLSVIALMIRLDSKGPIFFRHTRIGRNAVPFVMFKFRTMIEAKHWSGPPLSPRNDPRVTTIGVFLRRFKINELPQLINVLKGDMSFVGPRPEVPEFVDLYSDEEKRILSVRPGIVGPSQIHMRNEEDLYVEGVDPNAYYIEHILPEKLKMDLTYVEDASLLGDLKYLLQGLGITITGAVTRRHLFENSEQIGMFFCDIFVCAFSYFLAYFLRMDGNIPPVEKSILVDTLPVVIVARILSFTYFGLYGTLVQYLSLDEVLKIIRATTFSTILIVMMTFFMGERGHPRSVFAIDWFILIGLMAGYRLSAKAFKSRLVERSDGPESNILIYGAEAMGDLALRYLKMQGNGNVVAFIDDDPKKMRKRFQGVKILGGRHDIEALVRLYRIDRVLIAAQNLGPQDLEHIKSLCKKANVKYEVFALAN